MLAGALQPAGAAGAKPAFPGAEGHGAGAAGGRRGRIIHVTTLADSGPGSLRACIAAEGPRVCVFRTAGVIRFTTRRPLIRNPYLTIAGETAPGGGILVTHAGGADGLTPIAIKQSHDIVIRHIRVRTDRIAVDRESNSAFTIEHSRNVILDHVSGSWALDQNLSGHGENDAVTVSWSIFAEGIPRHDKCALLASDPVKPQRFSLIRSLCAHNGDRNPDANFPPRSCVEITNNIFYNAQSQFAEVWEGAGGTPISFVGNIFRRGPDTVAAAAAIDRPTIGSRGRSRIHASGNLIDDGMALATPPAQRAMVAEPPCRPQSRAVPARQAWIDVLGAAGALPRDAVDRRLVAETIDRGGRLARQPGSMPAIAGGVPYPDADQDGMDDGWESRHGSNPARADPWGDADRDGWLNLEDFLDWRHRQLVEAERSRSPSASARRAGPAERQRRN